MEADAAASPLPVPPRRLLCFRPLSHHGSCCNGLSAVYSASASCAVSWIEVLVLASWAGSLRCCHFYVPSVRLLSCLLPQMRAWLIPSSRSAQGREAALVYARLEANATAWPYAEVFYNVPNRCQCCIAFYRDEETGTLYHFSAVSAAGTYDDIMGVLRCGSVVGAFWMRSPDWGVMLWA